MFISCSKIHNLRAYLAQDRRWRRGLDVRNNAAVLFIQHKTAGGDVDWMNGRSSAILMSVRVFRNCSTTILLRSCTAAAYAALFDQHARFAVVISAI